MYKRYQGNSGRVVRVDEAPKPAPPEPVRTPEPPRRDDPRGRPSAPPASIRASAPPRPPGPLPLPFLQELETEDLLMLLILYLLYRESGDKELLVIIGALLFV